MYFLHRGDTEIGGFGITNDADGDLLHVTDFVTVKQTNTSVTVKFDDDAVADFFEDQVAAGLKPHQFARIWVHTHPMESPNPSGVDEETFHRVFGKCDASIMFIIGRTHETFARLRFNAGPGGEVMLNVTVDWASWPGHASFYANQMEQMIEGWHKEFEANINPERMTMSGLHDFGSTREKEDKLLKAWQHGASVDIMEDERLVDEFLKELDQEEAAEAADQQMRYEYDDREYDGDYEGEWSRFARNA